MKTKKTTHQMLPLLHNNIKTQTHKKTEKNKEIKTNEKKSTSNHRNVKEKKKTP